MARPSKVQKTIKQILEQVELLSAKQIQDLEAMLKLMEGGNTAVNGAINSLATVIAARDELSASVAKLRSEQASLALTVASLRDEIEETKREKTRLLARNALLAADNATLADPKRERQVVDAVVVHSGDR